MCLASVLGATRTSYIADGSVNWYNHFGELFDKI